MTLQVSAPITLGDVLAELRIVNPSRALPISLGDTDVRTLAGVASGPISLSNLYGKSSYIPMTVTGHDNILTDSATGVQYTGHVSPSVSVTGGLGGYSYLWTITGGDAGFSISSGATSSSPDITHVIGKFGYTGNCILQCAASDTGHTVTKTGIVAGFNIT